MVCIPFDEKMGVWKCVFLGLLSVATLKQWGLDEGDIAEVTFAYLNITSANFRWILTAIGQVIIPINKNINTTSY